MAFLEQVTQASLGLGVDGEYQKQPPLAKEGMLPLCVCGGGAGSAGTEGAGGAALGRMASGRTHSLADSGP